MTDAQPSVVALEGYEDRVLGPHTTALLGKDAGKYPDANGLIVRGSERTALIEPTLGVKARLHAGALPPLGSRDLVILSHCHEDHIPALVDLPEPDCWVHELDRSGCDDIESFLDLYGLPDEQREIFRRTALDRFSYAPRPHARAFANGHVWDLGGVRIEAVHAPGHTAGHCFLHVQPDGVLFLGDVDLSTFGPYYGDATSSVDAFEKSIALARGIEAEWYLSGHHKGLIEGRDNFLALLDRYGQVIPRRDQRLLEFLDEPRTIAEVAAHRLVYRPHDRGLFVEPVEQRSAELHVARLLRQGRISEVSPSSEEPRYQACTPT